MKPSDRLARLHCVNALLDSLTGHDLYLASQVLGAIDAAETELAAPTAGDLAARLTSIHQELLGRSPDTGFAYCDGAPDRNAGPLFVRAEMLAALRKNAPRPRTTIMVGNLPGSADAAAEKPKNRAAGKRAKEHAETVSHLRDLAIRRANPRSVVTLLFV